VNTESDALSVIDGLDEQEQFALERAMLEHFGPCTCQTTQLIGGASASVQICARHRFLEEQDANVSRLQRLVYVRRTRAYWNQQEMCGFVQDDASRTGGA
jgi:hypothetical protein